MKRKLSLLLSLLMIGSTVLPTTSEIPRLYAKEISVEQETNKEREERPADCLEESEIETVSSSQSDKLQSNEAIVEKTESKKQMEADVSLNGEELEQNEMIQENEKNKEETNPGNQEQENFDYRDRILDFENRDVFVQASDEAAFQILLSSLKTKPEISKKMQNRASLIHQLFKNSLKEKNTFKLGMLLHAMGYDVCNVLVHLHTYNLLTEFTASNNAMEKMQSLLMHYAIDSEKNYDSEIEEILSYALDRGFANDNSQEASLEASLIAIPTLAPFQNNEMVRAKLLSAIDYITEEFQGMKLTEDETYQVAAKLLFALVSCGIDPLEERFNHSGTSLLDLMQPTIVSDNNVSAELYMALSAYDLFMRSEQKPLSFYAYLSESLQNDPYHCETSLDSLMHLVAKAELIKEPSSILQECITHAKSVKLDNFIDMSIAFCELDEAITSEKKQNDPVDPTDDKKISVQFVLRGVPKDIWVDQTLDLSADANVFDTLVRICSSQNIEILHSNGFITKIGSLSNQQLGKKSGWMYCVNGQSPWVTMKDYILKDHDQVLIYFTYDYEKDIDYIPEIKPSPQPEVSGGAGGNIILSKIMKDYEKRQTDKAIVPSHRIASSLSTAFRQIKTEDLSLWGIYALLQNGESISLETLEPFLKEIEKKEGNFEQLGDLALRIMVLTKAGIDVRSIGGIDLYQKLHQFEEISSQSTSGISFALIAEQTQKKEQGQELLFLNELMKRQTVDGGFSLFAKMTSSVDITAMALSALSFYSEDAKVKTSIEKALKYLETVQKDNGLYDEYGGESSESIAQIIIALCQLSINPDRFLQKNNVRLIENLMKFEGEGGYRHTQNESLIASENAAAALTAYQFLFDENKRYYEADENPTTNTLQHSTFLFADEKQIEDKNVAYIQKAVEKKWILGYENQSFQPKKNITRAEFMKLWVLSYKEKHQTQTSSIFQVSTFAVNPFVWYAPYANQALQLGLLNETDLNNLNEDLTLYEMNQWMKNNNIGNPNEYITREEAIASLMEK